MHHKSSPARIATDRTSAAGDPYASGTVKKAAWQYLLGRILTGCAGFAYLIILVRVMDAVAFARFVTMLGYAATVGLFCGFGLDKVASRYVPEGRLFHIGPRLNHLIAALTVIRSIVLIIAAVLTYFAWAALEGAFFGGVLEMPAGLMVLIVGLNLFQFLTAILQALVQQKLLTQILVAQWVVRLTTLAVLINAGSRIGLTEALLISAVPELIGALALAIFIRAYLLRISKNVVPSTGGAAWPSRPAMLKLALHNCGYAWLVAPPQGNSMVMMSASLVAAPFVAAYGFFTGLIDRIKMYLPMMLVLNLVEPVLTAGYMKDRNFKDLADRAVLLYKINCLVVLMLATWTAIVAAPLTSILTNGRFLEYSLVLPVVLVQLALGSQNIVLQIIVNNVGRSDFLTMSGLAALLAMGLSLVLLIGAQQSRYFYFLPLIYEVFNSAALIFLLRKSGFDYPSTTAFHIGLCLTSAAAYLLCAPVPATFGAPLTAVICAALGVGAIFLLSLYLLRPLRAEEWAVLRQIVTSKR
jgi:O-antigen/teichoic acid export membrane protein